MGNSEIRIFHTNLENNGTYRDVVLLSDHLDGLIEVEKSHKSDWSRLNRAFKTASDKTIDQDIRIGQLEKALESSQTQLMSTQEFSLCEIKKRDEIIKQLQNRLDVSSSR